MFTSDDNKLRHRHEEVLPQVSSPRGAASTQLITLTVTTDVSSPQHNGVKVAPALASPAYPDSLKNRDHHFGQQYMLALTLAGMCSSLLSTIFGLFHVDVFLRVYQLPLHAYSIDTLIFSVINTANNVMGAWLLDTAATKMNRSDLIGLSGCIFSICFLAPFFRWKNPSTNGLYDQAHFIVSMSMYDTLFSFTAILLGSLVTDNHHLTDRERVNFMASGKILNLVSAFVIAKIGLDVFDQNDMQQFRLFLVSVATTVALLFLTAQTMTRYNIFIRWKSFKVQLLDTKQEKPQTFKANEKLKPHQVFKDFWRHDNFWAWIWMELLLESQNSFSSAFLKTFVDRLLHDEGMSREQCDWLLSISRPLGLVLGIFCYIPIRNVGYKKVYHLLFAVNFVTSFIMVLIANHQSTAAITCFLFVYPAITSAVAASGFHLVMSDMVLEMKRTHAQDGRFDEPSLAGLFMGVNALFCKPAESILPVVSAHMLENYSLVTEDDENVQKVLYKLLVIPPLLFSVVEFLSWRRYTLTPAKTNQMRDNLRKLELNHFHMVDDDRNGVLPMHKISEDKMSLS